MKALNIPFDVFLMDEYTFNNNGTIFSFSPKSKFIYKYANKI